MSSAAQIAANRQNAQSSTGPRTDAGKAASSQNAMKHGATSSTVVLAFEDPAEFERIHAEFVKQLQPATGLEHFLVDDMVACHWRMKRMQKIILFHMDRAAYEHDSHNPMLAMSDVMLSPEVAKLQRYENSFRRAYERSWAKLKELQKQRSAANVQNEPNVTPRAGKCTSSAPLLASFPDCSDTLPTSACTDSSRPATSSSASGS